MRKLAPRYRGSKAASASLLTDVLCRLFPNGHLSPRFDPLFADGLTREWLEANRAAWRATCGLGRRDVAHVGVFSSSHGGSHVFTTQFHFLRSVFCFGESIHWVDPSRWRFRTFLLRSTFAINGLQDKQISDVSHYLYNINGGRCPWPNRWDARRAGSSQRYWILYLRNPLRTLLSLDATGKSKWRMTPDFANSFFTSTRQRLEAGAMTRKLCPSRFKLVLHEDFCQRSEQVLSEVCGFLGLDEESLSARPVPRDFFKRFARCGQPPVLEDGWLVSPVSGERIEGWGGRFNPNAPIKGEDAFAQKLAAALPPEILALARQAFGDRLTDFWLADEEHRYASVDQDLLWGSGPDPVVRSAG